MKVKDLRNELASIKGQPRPTWSKIPADKHGVYVVCSERGGMPDFKDVSNGGSFRKQSPTVPVDTLKDAWVDRCLPPERRRDARHDH